jgi:uncharacterized protein YbcV (DUF1398 family)
MKHLVMATAVIVTILALASCRSTHRLTTQKSDNMFTLEQIKNAHSKVKSGADFPAYIREIKQLGVLSYETFVTDGHTDYSGTHGYVISSEAKYGPLTISGTSDKEQFKIDLKAHQQGKSDYQTFCRQCAGHGIEKWIVDLDKMTCVYYDLGGKEVLLEVIAR